MKKAGKGSHEEQYISPHLSYTQVKCETEDVGTSQRAGLILGSVWGHAMETQSDKSFYPVVSLQSISSL